MGKKQRTENHNQTVLSSKKCQGKAKFDNGIEWKVPDNENWIFFLLSAHQFKFSSTAHKRISTKLNPEQLFRLFNQHKPRRFKNWLFLLKFLRKKRKPKRQREREPKNVTGNWIFFSCNFYLIKTRYHFVGLLDQQKPRFLNFFSKQTENQQESERAIQRM